MSYQLVNRNAQILPVHAALFPPDRRHRAGKVLYFSGSQHIHPVRSVDATRLWDVLTRGIRRVGSPRYDLFCSGHAFLADGRLLVGGGTQLWDVDTPDHLGHQHFRGLRATSVFNPRINGWQRVASMIPAPPGYRRPSGQGGGRWYPTLLTLGDGRVFAMSGHPENSDTRHNNWTTETFNVAPRPRGRWTRRADQIQLGAPDGYPRLHLLPNGQIFSATAMNGGVWRWNATGPGRRRVAGGPGAGYTPSISWSSVLLPLLPPNYRTRVLVVGRTVARVIDLGDRGIATTARWRDTRGRVLSGVAGGHGRNPIRLDCTAVLLPDGKVLVVGGTTGGSPSHPVRAAELYDPQPHTAVRPGRWTRLASSRITRGYHSVALLLPDGRVWVAGSDLASRNPADKELRIELFSPPYMFARSRPRITTAPPVLRHWGCFTLITPQAAQIRSVALLRCSSVTHAFSSDQRYVGLQIIHRGTTRLLVATPPDTNVAPPGVYLLFVVDSRGIPSVGRFTRLG